MDFVVRAISSRKTRSAGTALGIVPMMKSRPVQWLVARPGFC